MNEEEKNNSENTELVETEQNDSYVPAEQESADESFKNDSFYKIAKGKGIFNLPNKLTISRMVMIPVFILFFYLDGWIIKLIPRIFKACVKLAREALYFLQQFFNRGGQTE